MTIRRRLVVSNVLMIVVPVFVSVVVAVCCIGTIWFTVARGTGLGFEDSEDFYRASVGISELATDGIRNKDRDKQLKSMKALSKFLDKGAMSLVVTADGDIFYQYGEAGKSAKDRKLAEAAKALNNEAVLTSGNRNVSIHSLKYNGVDYVISIYNTQKDLSYDSLEMAIAIAGTILIIAILLSVLFTNRFLTRFVFRRIDEPLDKLADGVNQISRGNLDYRMEHFEKDEFAPVFTSFNDMAARLKDSVERTRREEESRKELMASVSHDLRTPLTSIHAYVEGLIDGVARTQEIQRKYLDTIKERTEELEGMVSHILEYSRIDMETSTGNLTDVRLDEYLNSEVGAMAQDYRERGMDITCKLDPVTVSADPDELHRLFVNIADNSLKYKTAERVHLDIELADNGDTCRLMFTDDGPGVPEESLVKLFDLFYRTDASRQDRDQGNGLGLALVHRIVRNMGGDVRAENSSAGGLSIIMEFPKGGSLNA